VSENTFKKIQTQASVGYWLEKKETKENKIGNILHR
jgi:hypothetical protein